MDAGYRLRWVGDPAKDFTWRDLKVFVRESHPDGALYRSLHPDTWMWDNTNMLLASIADMSQIQAWQKTKDGSKGRRPPKPIPRPGVDEDAKKRRVKGDAIPMDKFKERLAAVRNAVKRG